MHNVKPRKYPSILVYTGFYDDRVHPGHALRFATLLKKVGAHVYLRVETNAGHMGVDPSTKARELGDLQAFLDKVSEIS